MELYCMELLWIFCFFSVWEKNQREGIEREDGVIIEWVFFPLKLSISEKVKHHEGLRVLSDYSSKKIIEKGCRVHLTLQHQKHTSSTIVLKRLHPCNHLRKAWNALRPSPGPCNTQKTKIKTTTT